ncbi:MAG: dihydroxyacetone kinase subunit DhaK [archaeon]|nr:dihydroxyacetone kinase subunit DhaK [archaeon]
MKKMKKIINDPKKVCDELLEGAIEASNGKMIKLDGVNALVKTDIPEGKVGLLIGGGSGHEPLFPGFVGKNMADGAACGPIFAAPPPNIAFEATKYINGKSGGKGVLFLYGNYAGDNMNFDISAELCEDEGIEVKTVRIWDDVASAPPERMQDRRGIAGDLFVIKVAGGAAATLDTLDEVVRVTTKARDNVRTMGVSIAAGSIPETGEPTFELPDDEIEIGMGLHGEPGVLRQKMTSADSLIEQMMEKIISDLPFNSGDEVVLLVNDLGSTTMMELLIANRKISEILKNKKIKIHETLIGSYCTCQEMAGLSITMMKLDNELKKYYDMPASSIGFKKM